MVQIGFLIFGSFQLPKYQNELEECQWKWGLATHLLDNPVRFYTGEIPNEVPFYIETMLVQIMSDKKPNTWKDAHMKAAQHFFESVSNLCDFQFVCTTAARLDQIAFHEAVRSQNPHKVVEIEDFQCENSVLLSHAKMRDIVQGNSLKS